MEYLLDDPVSERVYQEILRKVKPLQNGEVSESMTQRGVVYKLNLGASVVSLQLLAAGIPRIICLHLNFGISSGAKQ